MKVIYMIFNAVILFFFLLLREGKFKAQRNSQKLA